MRELDKIVEQTPAGYVPILKVKGEGRIDLGVYSTMRGAAVAHDVARLILIQEKRPGAVWSDNGTHFPLDAYKYDHAFTDLLDNKTSFADVCSLLRSGALTDQFLVTQERTTRKASSNTSGDRSTLSRQRSMPQLAQQERQQERQPSARPQVERQKSGAAPPPPSQQQQSAPQPPKQQADKVQSPRAAAASPPQPEAKRSAGSAGAPAAPPAAASPGVAAQGAGSAGAPAAAAAAVAGGDGPGSSSPKKRPHRWLEWPAKGCGQFATCISERALKNSMTLPARMKRELFQVSDAVCEIAVYDMRPGSNEKWTWEVRDYIKDERQSTYLYNLGTFFRFYQASAGDVLVAVASAPGAVKATVWKTGSEEAKDFLAHLEKQAARQGGGSGSGAGGGKKRGADSSAPRQPPSKAAKASAGGVASGAAGKAQARSGSGKPRQASSSPDASRQLSKSASLPAQRKLQQPEQGQQQQQQAPKASGVAAAAASHAAVAAASAPLAQAAQQHAQEPQAQRLQREELLAMAEAGVDPSHPAASGEDTMQLSPMAQVAQSPFRKAPLAEAPVAGSGHLPDVKPERQASGAQQGSGAEAQQALPDPLTLANDEDGVYHAMSRLLALVASTGRVPTQAVSSYRRFFGRLEPAGKRWWHYDSLRQMVDSGEWDELAAWLNTK
ncbi:hypothetical protein COHA_002063 [Chlorella ohadii]|uniref:Uncharacterized protein n=1 Tax=Chlorella ohadii TaxID=2649997 RepID=A0AAD5H897_9CHLO|nr:hypothetical protein COHA_002063 [Chlorella ohadii]